VRGGVPARRCGSIAFDDIPCLLEADGVCWAHLGAIGISPVELGVDQRADVDAIDRHVLDLAVDVTSTSSTPRITAPFR
jgi:hypothetical protein